MILNKKIVPNFTSRETIEDRIWWKMCDYNMGMPVPLNKADLSESFVYDRKFGVFPVGRCYHQFVMATLQAWNLGKEDYLDIEKEEVGSKRHHFDVYDISDFYLTNTVGTCYLSSISSTVQAGKKGNLNSRELDYFYPVRYNRD
jgi:hypothetical protein